MFIPWEPPPSSFLNAKFDGSVRDKQDGAGFIIRGSGSRLVAARGSHFLELMVPEAKLRAAWTEIVLARRILGVS